MNEFIVNYDNKSTKLFTLISAGYFIVLGIYTCVKLVMVNTLNFNFYTSLVAIVLAVTWILKATLWAPNPLFKLNTESLYVNMPGEKTFFAEWVSIREVAIGVSYLKILETDGKNYTVGLSGLKYADLKASKAQIIEACESKKIAYRND